MDKFAYEPLQLKSLPDLIDDIDTLLRNASSYLSSFYDEYESVYDQLESINSWDTFLSAGGTEKFCFQELLAKQLSLLDVDYEALMQRLGDFYGYTRNRIVVDRHNSSPACSITKYVLAESVMIVPKFFESGVYRQSLNDNLYYVVSSAESFDLYVDGVQRTISGVVEFIGGKRNVEARSTKPFDVYAVVVTDTTSIKLDLKQSGLVTVYIRTYVPCIIEASAGGRKFIQLTNENNIAPLTVHLTDSTIIEVETFQLNQTDDIFEGILVDARWQNA